MNRLEVFEKVKTHLLKQNAKALNSNSQCVYETLDGLKCAIGCLIPTGHKGLGYWGSIRGLLNTNIDLKELWGIDDDRDYYFLRQLQLVHDKFDPTDWEAELANFKKNHFD